MKAVLVLDMPNECDECPLQDGEKCYARQDWISTISNWKCPLRPLPQKESEKRREEIEDWAGLAYSQGWNDCLDAITGENE